MGRGGGVPSWFVSQSGDGHRRERRSVLSKERSFQPPTPGKKRKTKVVLSRYCTSILVHCTMYICETFVLVERTLKEKNTLNKETGSRVRFEKKLTRMDRSRLK